MYINSDTIISATEANQNFSKVIKKVNEYGEAYIFKNNKPKYHITEVVPENEDAPLSEDEIIDRAARKILDKYKPAFLELAK